MYFLNSIGVLGVIKCEKISEKKFYKIFVFQPFFPHFWLDMKQATSVMMTSQKKFFFDKSNFIRPFYLTIWVGPDCNFKNVNSQPALM